jgi:hypothetical protein
VALTYQAARSRRRSSPYECGSGRLASGPAHIKRLHSRPWYLEHNLPAIWPFLRFGALPGDVAAQLKRHARANDPSDSQGPVGNALAHALARAISTDSL